jgi:hypothetical protein
MALASTARAQEEESAPPPEVEAPPVELERSAARPPVPANSIALIAGVYTRAYWGQSFSIADVGYEPNFVLGLISATDVLRTSWGLTIGHESGIALRFGTTISFEMWRGLTVSFGSRQIGGWVLTPKVILGLSTIANMIGVEAERELVAMFGAEGDSDRLIYLGSELAESREALPDVEVFYRLHHRSGLLGLWGNVEADHNANAVGIRLYYD